MRLGRAFVGFLALMLAGFGFMSLWSMPRIDAGGLDIFDTRPSYDLAAARDFLEALSAEGRAAYLGPQRLADTLFPVGLTGVMALTIGWGLRGWLGRTAWLLALVPLVYFTFDMLENARVAGLLRIDPAQLTADQVARASAATEWKFLWVKISLGLAALALVAGLVNWRRKGGARP